MAMATDGDEERRKSTPADSIVSPHFQSRSDSNLRENDTLRQEIERVRSSLSAEIEVLRSQRSQLVESLSTEEIKLLRQRIFNDDEGRINKEFTHEGRTNERFECKAVDKKEEKRDFLPRDTFSLFILGKPLSGPFLCASAVFAAQIVTFVFLLTNVIDGDNHEDNRRPNPMQLPPDTTLGVRMCQVLAIVITVFSEDNIVTTLNASSRGYDEASLLESGFGKRSRAWWIVSLVLRLLEGCLALIATFMLIVQTNTARDVLLNFTAVQFVSLLDDVVFGIAELGYLGEGIQNGIEQVKKPQSVLAKKTWLWFMYLPAILVSVLAFWLWLSYSQARGVYLCDNIYVQFGDEIIPDLAHFSGIYLRKAAIRWGETVEYYEARHLRNSDQILTDYKPARFGYCENENAWVFSRSSDGISEPSLCDDWQLRSTRTDSYDIISTSPSTSSRWFARKDSLEVPMQWFYLSCYDCSGDFCGEHGTCSNNFAENMCECDAGWYGLRCEFETPCDSLIVDTVTTAAFEAEPNGARRNVRWPITYERMDGVDVYNRPVYFGNGTYESTSSLFQEQNVEDSIAQVAVLVIYTGRRWEFVPSFNVDIAAQTTDHEAIADAFFFQKDFHGHWTKYVSDYVSSPSDIDSSTDRATPQGLSWNNARGAFLEEIDPVVICQGVIVDNTIRSAIRLWQETSDNGFGSISSWDTSAVTDMSGLFVRDEQFNEPLASWDTTSVTDTSAMFLKARKFNQNLAPWSVGGVRDMSLMFSGARSFNQDISSWDTSNVWTMNGMFKRAQNFNQDIGGWDTSSVTEMREMFSHAWSFSQDLSGWKTDHVTDMLLMFAEAESFNGDISTWNTASVTTTVGMFYFAVGFNRDVSKWNMISVRSTWGMFQGAKSFNQDVGRWDLRSVGTMEVMFEEAESFNQNLSSWNTTGVTSMRRMFYGAGSFNGSLSGWDTSRVVDMESMFQHATDFNQNISDWNTSQVTVMMSIFQDASAFNQDLSLWDTSHVEDFTGMFHRASNFNGDVSGWNTSRVEFMNKMFQEASSFNREIKFWTTSSLLSMEAMFAGATVFNQEISTWDTSKVITMHRLFEGAEAFNQNLSEWTTSKVRNMHSLFQNATFFNGNVSGWDTSQVTNMKTMFSGAKSFNGDMSNWNTLRVNNMHGMFRDASAFDPSDLMWSTAAVTDMSHMFSGASVFNGDISSWTTTRVLDMNGMFHRATEFNRNLSMWDTSAVTDMADMFSGAVSFNQDLSHFDTGAVTTMKNMFWGAASFNQNISDWTTSLVKDMGNMFRDASSFNGNITSWRTVAVKSTKNMFFGATSFNQNISKWDTSSVVDMSFMFRDAVAFKQTLCWKLNLDVATTGMFCGSGGSFDVSCVQWRLTATIARHKAKNRVKCEERTGIANQTVKKCAATLATLLAEESQKCS